MTTIVVFIITMIITYLVTKKRHDVGVMYEENRYKYQITEEEKRVGHIMCWVIALFVAIFISGVFYVVQ